MEKPFKFALPSPNFNKNVKDACKPKPHFLTPSGMSLLPREKQPPPMYGKHGATVPPRYLETNATGQKPTAEEPVVKQYCEPCELELQSLEDLKRHRAQHEKCPVAGCQFRGHPSIMDKHINALHASGLFDKFKKLSTPEEIAAWRDERKKRYPTLANVLLKQKAQEQRQKRGERLDAKKNRFGKETDRKRAHPNKNEAQNDGDEKVQKEGKQQNQRNKRNHKNKRNQKSREPKVKPERKKEVKDLDENKDKSGEVCCGGVKLFKGTGQMKDYKHLNDKKKLPVNNALFGLVGMYGSDDSEENDSEDESNDIENNDTTVEICESNDVTMEAVCCTDSKENGENIKTDQDEDMNKRRNEDSTQFDVPQNKCTFLFNKESDNKNKEPMKDFSPSTTDNDGPNEIIDESIISPALEEITKENSCEADAPLAITENSSDEAPEETPIQRSIPDYPLKPEKVTSSQTNEPLAKRSKPEEQTLKRKQHLVKRKSGLDYRKARVRKQNTMLEKLLETDIRHERNVLLQCVRYVCENNYFGVGQTNQTKPD